MQKDTIIYVTDQRQKYLADMLGGEHTDCRNSGGIDYERVVNIVFPTPFSKLYLFKKIQGLAYILPSSVFFINSTFNF